MDAKDDARQQQAEELSQPDERYEDVRHLDSGVFAGWLRQQIEAELEGTEINAEEAFYVARKVALATRYILRHNPQKAGICRGTAAYDEMSPLEARLT